MRKTTLLFIALVMASFSVYSKSVSNVTIVGANGIADNTGYATLKEAFDAINAQADQSGKDIEIQINANTTETATAVLNQPTTASWNSLTIYPTAADVTIGGDFLGTLIDLYGADYVTINGKLNKTGAAKSLTISQNFSTDNAARTIRFANDAKNNTVSFCRIKGSCPSSGAGIIFFSTAMTTPTTGTGNDDNTISYNDITKSATTGPYSVIYSAGTSGATNDRIIIDNNNIYDTYTGGTIYYAIRLASHTNECTITNNNIYETSTSAPTGALNYWGIYAGGVGVTDKFTISNNCIGGNAPGCVGTFRKSNSGSNQFTGIYLSVSTSTNSSNIQGNVIKNIEWKNSTTSKNFIGVQAIGSAVNIGTTTANIISDIAIEHGAISGSNFYGFTIQNTAGLITVENNTITGITLNNTDAAHGSNFYGMYKTNSAGEVNFSKNIIGGTAANSITANSTATSNSQVVAGISTFSGTLTSKVTISDNIIRNINNNSSSSLTTNSSYGVNCITASLYGSISANKIYNITASSASSPASVIGINMDETSTNSATICANNMISLGNSNAGIVYGIMQRTGLAKVFHNSVYLAGNPLSGSYESAALNATGSTAGREFLNNILISARSNSGTASSKHYTVKYAATTNLLSDYNVVNYTGIGGLLGAIGATDYATGNDWSAAAPTGTGLDTQSKVTDITFTAPATGDLTIAGLSVQDVNLSVPKLDAVLTDMFGTVRANPTYAGAHQSTLPFPTTGLDKALMQAGVHISKAGVEVRVDETSNIELYTLNGTLIDRAVVNNLYSRALNNGMYIVKINGKAVKFVK